MGGGKKNSGARLFVERALKVDFHIYAEILLSKFLAGLKDKVIHQMCFFSAMRLLRSHVVQGGKKTKTDGHATGWTLVSMSVLAEDRVLSEEAVLGKAATQRQEESSTDFESGGDESTAG